MSESLRQASAGQAFDEYAENYQQVLANALSLTGEDSNYYAARRISWFAGCLRELGHVPQAVLDYGCGVGSSAPFLLQMKGVVSLVGVDPSTAEIRQAQQHYGSERARFVSLPEFVPAAQLDAAYCNGVFHHIPPAERLEGATTIWRALRPGGCWGSGRTIR
ncbi:MAG TPA: class I SAM-dependent methyltransferase [Terriglobales bacterium]|nr:class I SAM-dependent methyltransferase [Terriglobales bacterium]